jgi:hypothetical protein
MNMKREIVVSEEVVNSHFSEIASKYRSLRTTDLEPTSNLSNLVEKARNKHYSTFTLYSDDIFEESLETFNQNIRNNFDDLEKIQRRDENILLQIRK